MKKNYLKYIVIAFIIFILNTSNVFAEKKCVYGEVGEDGKWHKQVTIDFDYDRKFILGNDSSPFFDRKFITDVKEIYPVSGKKQNKIPYQFQVDVGGLDSDIYFNINNVTECPSKIYVGEGKNGLKKNDGCEADEDFAYIITHDLAFYSSPLSKTEAQKFFGCYMEERTFTLEETENMTSEEKKEKDPYSCYDFSNAMKTIDKTLKDNTCDNNPKFDEAYNDLNNLCSSYRSSFNYKTANDGTDSGEEAENCMKACNALNDEIDDKCSVEPPKGAYCGTFGNDMINWIIKIFKYVRYGLPAILIILSVMDFIKAITQEDDSKMKEAQKRFIHRLIAIALLFVIPFLLNFVLRIFNIPGLDAKNPFCIF